MLPLSWIEEKQCYGYFPGETWLGKTWLEQNRIVAEDAEMVRNLLDRCPGKLHLRYLLPLEPPPDDNYDVDEIGYLLKPPDYDYDIEKYYREFSHKSIKRIKKEVAGLENSGLSYRYDDLADFEHLVQLNISIFGQKSYYYDQRFQNGFRSLMHYLHDNGWLRITTILAGDKVAAVDMGCLYREHYTLLAGGTNGDYPGVAKMINLHHMQRACREKMKQVDFLCGNFSWKQMFHLSPRPLYLISNCPSETHSSSSVEVGRAGHVV